MCPQVNYQFGCSQVGPAHAEDVLDRAPTFLVKNGTRVTTVAYKEDSSQGQGSKYVVAVGPLHMLPAAHGITRPSRTFYLVVNDISEADDGNRFCARQI